MVQYTWQDFLPFYGIGRYLNRTLRLRGSINSAIKSYRYSDTDSFIEQDSPVLDKCLKENNVSIIDDTNLEDVLKNIRHQDINFKNHLRLDMKIETRLQILYSINAAYLMVGASVYMNSDKILDYMHSVVDKIF